MLNTNLTKISKTGNRTFTLTPIQILSKIIKSLKTINMLVIVSSEERTKQIKNIKTH